MLRIIKNNLNFLVSARIICEILLLFIFFSTWLYSTPVLAHVYNLDFDTFRLGDGKKTVLVIGGIQGDEPGGFSAANLLATRYEINNGSLWVVPNLNFPSIIKKSRGLHGDMNRKFSVLDEKDPEFETVRRIQELIDEPSVKLVLNLHDGSGYYRPIYIDKMKNPARWGQSVIIDQEFLPNTEFMAELNKAAEQVAEKANTLLLKDKDKIHVHNTRTVEGDREMEKSLSYYAVRQNKAAFGLEASKELSVAERVYYHLSMIEEFLRMAGVEFKRDFELNPSGIDKALSENLGVSFAGNRIFLPLDNARKNIKYLPLARGEASKPIMSKPIMAVVPCEKEKDALCVHYGNRLLSVISPSWHETDDNLETMRVIVDGQEKVVAFGQIVTVSSDIKILKEPGFRVNAIGFDKGLKDESEISLKLKDFEKRFSLDKDGSLFRVEVYKGNNFAGMFLLSFANSGNKAGGKNAQKRFNSTPATKGPESAMGY